MYGLAADRTVAIFWPETGETERLDIDQTEFYRLIKQDPDGTINYSLYRQAVEKLGELSLGQHFAFKIELALGGQLDVDNVVMMDATEHMNMLGKLAQRISGLPVGTRFDRVSIERK
jgi:hypothetical protein